MEINVRNIVRTKYKPFALEIRAQSLIIEFSMRPYI